MNPTFKIVVIATMISFCFTSCSNNNKNETASVNTSIPEQENVFREQIKQHPDSLLLKEKLIQYFRESGNYSQAIAETELALKSDSMNSRLWFIKATLHTENADTLLAIKSWENVAYLDPSAENLMSLGSLYALTKNIAALEVADALLKLPKAKAQPQALFIKGLYFSAINAKAIAIKFFDDCLLLDYSNLMAYREKAVCLYDTGKYLDALKTLELAIAVKKTYDEAYYWMGRCYEKLNNKTAAIQNYQLALQLDPYYVEAKDALEKLGVKAP